MTRNKSVLEDAILAISLLARDSGRDALTPTVQKVNKVANPNLRQCYDSPRNRKGAHSVS